MASSDHNATEAQLAAALARCAAGERAALRVIYDIEAARMVSSMAASISVAMSASFHWIA